MKCPVCNGKGFVHNALGNFEEDCGYCHGTGNVAEPLTNEEWFNGLATEEKAKRIINIAVNSDCDYRTIVEWLKQPHNEVAE